MTTARPRTAGAWGWTAILAAGLVSGLVCSTQPDGWRTVATYELPGAAAVVLIFLAVRSYRPRPARPWLYLALGVGLSVIADFLWDGLPMLSIRPGSSGHLADVCYLASYPAYILAGFHFLGARASRRDVTLLIDGALFALAGWLALWVLVVHPQLSGGGLSVWDWLPTVLYPPLDIMVIILLWRLGRGDLRRSAPWRLLFTAFVIMFVADGLYALLAMPYSGWVSDGLNTAWIMSYAFIAAAAAHPAMRFLIADPEPVVPGPDHLRVAGVGVALMTPLLLLLIAPDGIATANELLVPVGIVLIFGAAARFMIVAERHRDAETTLSLRAINDPLTGLANRSALLDRLDLATRRAARQGDSCAVLFLDLDDFKIVNDSMGHNTGDEILQAVAERLRRFARTDECVARLGGDEFVIVLEGVPGTDAAVEAAERLAGVFDEPFPLGTSDIQLTASIGLVPDAQKRVGAVESILRDADLAMYEAKRSEIHRIWVFESSMHQRAIERLEVKNALRTAVANAELALLYQPIYDTATREPIAVEALIRWQRDGVVVAPLDFIPIAEASGAIVPIGEWVLRTAARDLTAVDDPNLCVTVNVSPRQLCEPDFADRALEAVRLVALAPERMILEITEGALVEPDPTVDLNLESLGAAGFQVAIDDFGTGYSSLAYLKRLAVDWIKIDRVFVQDLGNSQNDEALVRAIIRMAHEVGLRVIAEGVETEAQLEVLTDLGCNAVQGYLLARPAPLDAFHRTAALDPG